MGWAEDPGFYRVAGSGLIGMPNRNRGRPVYVRSDNDVVIVGAKCQKGVMQFPLDWAEKAIPSGMRERKMRERARAEEKLAQERAGEGGGRV